MSLRLASTLLLLVLCWFFPGAATAAKLNVLTTFPPIDSLTRNVARDAADVTMLLPPNVGPHDFALSPSDLRKISAADVIVSNGLGIEDWLGKAIRSGAKKEVRQIVASTGVKTMGNPETIDAGGGHEHEHAHGEGGGNPHIWLDPLLAIKMTENIRDGLAGSDPANADKYRANAEAFVTKLRQLDEEIRAKTSTLTEKRLLSFHDTLPYFASRYGFTIVGVFEPFPGKEPSPKYLRKLRDTIVKNGVKALFSEPQYSPKILESLAADLKIPIAVIDPMETGESSAEFYEHLMRSNLRSLLSALHGS